MIDEGRKTDPTLIAQLESTYREMGTVGGVIGRKSALTTDDLAQVQMVSKWQGPIWEAVLELRRLHAGDGHQPPSLDWATWRRSFDHQQHAFRPMPETGMEHLCIECGHTSDCGSHPHSSAAVESNDPPPRLDAGEQSEPYSWTCGCGHKAVGCLGKQSDLLALRAEHQRLTEERDLWKESYKGTDHAQMCEEWQREREAMVEDKEAADAALAEAQQELAGCEGALREQQQEHGRVVEIWNGLEADVARLSEALETYGQHTPDCPALPANYNRFTRDSMPYRECSPSCGFAAVLQEQKK